MTALPTARSYHSHAHAPSKGRVALTYEDRFLRRKTLQLEDGSRILVDLPQTTSLDHGGVLVLLEYLCYLVCYNFGLHKVFLEV